MTGAVELLEGLRRRGFALAPEGDSLRITPSSRLSPELRQAIRAHRAELLALLRWDQAAADALLAQLRQEVGRLERRHFSGRFPEPLQAVVADGLAIAEGLIRDHALEAQ